LGRICKNRRGRPLDSLGTILNLVSTTTTRKGLEIEADMVDAKYEKDIKAGEDVLSHLNLDLKPN
jgi:hypothetical protein